MKFTEITPTFKDNEESNMIKMLVLLTAFIPLFPAIGGYFGLSTTLSDNAKKLLAVLTNFEICIFIACIIPLLAPIMWIINLIICLKAVSSISSNTKVEIPEIFSIITVEQNNEPKQ